MNSSMPRLQTSTLRRLFASRRQFVFQNHVRIASSIFSRPCSCSAALREDGSTAAPNVKAIHSSPPKPPADHRQLAKQQKLFVTSPYSPGSPLLTPNGADMFIKLQNLLRGLYPLFGFREVITPTIYKKSLWERSGHWENYAEDMFEVKGRGLSGQKETPEIGEDEEFGLKPMNCPGHCLLFDSEKRSYRDLPIRFADFSALHRNEISGALSGLTRVRRFHQDDAHIFCRPSQIEDEIKKTMDFIELIYSKIFDFGPYRLVLSTRPKENYIGALEEWDRAENQLKAALDHSGQTWSLNEGDGAFYGPKIDIILKDSDGKEHQTATIQLDFQLPQRFGLKYTVPNAEAELSGGSSQPQTSTSQAETVTPIIIHRAIMGSLERFMALLIEHYDGVYPFWLSPRPVTIITASDDPAVLSEAKTLQSDIANGIVRKESTMRPELIGNGLEDLGFHKARAPSMPHVEIDSSARSVAKKVHEAKTMGSNFIIVIGQRDLQSDHLNLQIWNQPRLDIVTQLLGTSAKVGKGEQVHMKRDDIVALLKTLCTYHL